jgi:hypothetical protein
VFCALQAVIFQRNRRAGEFRNCRREKKIVFSPAAAPRFARQEEAGESRQGYGFPTMEISFNHVIDERSTIRSRGEKVRQFESPAFLERKGYSPRLICVTENISLRQQLRIRTNVVSSASRGSIVGFMQTLLRLFMVYG